MSYRGVWIALACTAIAVIGVATLPRAFEWHMLALWMLGALLGAGVYAFLFRTLNRYNSGGPDLSPKLRQR
jgi:quinol-cytochrome oxidoreductase complex cytochrome b subunit